MPTRPGDSHISARPTTEKACAFLLQAVQAAVGLGADKVVLRQSNDGWVVDFSILHGQDDLSKFADNSGETEGLQTLRQSVQSMLSCHPKESELTLQGPQGGCRLSWRGVELSSQVLPCAPQARCKLKFVASQPEGFWQQLSRRVRLSTAEHLALSQRLAFCPIPIELDGRLLNNPDVRGLPGLRLEPTDGIWGGLTFDGSFPILAQSIVLQEGSERLGIAVPGPRTLPGRVLFLNGGNPHYNENWLSHPQVALQHWCGEKLKLGYFQECQGLPGSGGAYTVVEGQPAPPDALLFSFQVPLWGAMGAKQPCSYLEGHQTYQLAGLETALRGKLFVSRDPFDPGTGSPQLFKYTPLLRARSLITLSPRFEEESLIFGVHRGVVLDARHAAIGCRGMVAVIEVADPEADFHDRLDELRADYGRLKALLLAQARAPESIFTESMKTRILQQ